MMNVDVETLMESMDLMTTDVMIHVMGIPLRDVEVVGETQSTRSNMVRFAFRHIHFKVTFRSARLVGKYITFV